MITESQQTKALKKNLMHKGRQTEDVCEAGGEGVDNGSAEFASRLSEDTGQSTFVFLRYNAAAQVYN